MFLNVALFNILHPGHILPRYSWLSITSLEEDRISERGGSALNDSRPVYEQILDPLDIRELFRSKESWGEEGWICTR